MRVAFEILPSLVTPESCLLICELSSEGFSYVIKDDATNSFLGLAVYHFDKGTPPVGFPIALQILFHQHPVLSKRYKRTIINYSLPESVLIPYSLFDSRRSSDFLNIIHGDLHNNDAVVTEVIQEHSMYNSFRVPAAIYEVIQAQFAGAESTHQYSVLLREATPGNRLSVIFYTHKIVVSLVKDSVHQLVNCFPYCTADDVTYTLLNICRQFELENVPLMIAGLLEKSSLLYQQINCYFSSIEFASLPEGQNYNEEFAKYPAHYFSHIFAID